jgi:hypothetical protein
MVDYAAVLVEHYRHASWTLNGDEYDGLVWTDENVKQPTQSELDAAWPAVRDAGKWDSIRDERDRLLGASDWTQVADAPLTADEKTAWADYRQALRDVPQDFDSPDDVVWPEVP